ncbi:hypothetical protein [Kitasatospora sp. DSM 101779]|uniref:hypothetical protein n=1 Tax=Kitasatospora sp. DSM 101779 TaxID=2853165 RepID=UPI0021D82B53|nr:hypothetical protein [Kitasatospora sp. DSM 101779]MCU7824436.1 hypothetical protein [Kitasatospora sp. DSM 101779]
MTAPDAPAQPADADPPTDTDPKTTKTPQAADPADGAVRGLPLPHLLLDLIADGRWRHPGDEALAAALPWFADPVELLPDVAAVRRQSASLDDLSGEELGPLFRQARGSAADRPVELPWLDAEQAVLIAVARTAGDDTALALDYRTDPADPRVVGSDIWTNPQEYTWRVAAPSFTAFATALGLLEPDGPATRGRGEPRSPGAGAATAPGHP